MLGGEGEEGGVEGDGGGAGAEVEEAGARAEGSGAGVGGRTREDDLKRRYRSRLKGFCCFLCWWWYCRHCCLCLCAVEGREGRSMSIFVMKARTQKQTKATAKPAKEVRRQGSVCV